MFKGSRKLISKNSGGRLRNIQFIHSQGCDSLAYRRVGIFTIAELLFREIKEELDCQLKVCKQDELGRYVILKGFVQGQPFLFVNIYAPNKVMCSLW